MGFLTNTGLSRVWEHIQALVSGYVPTTRKVNGKALSADITLSASDVGALPNNETIPTSLLPSYVDDVLEYNAFDSFPATGETGKIYVDTTTNKTYRWSGSGYIEISASLALGENSSTAFAGDKGKVAYDHAMAKGSAAANGLYKITTNAEGHVTEAVAVEQADIAGLGIATEDYVDNAVVQSDWNQNDENAKDYIKNRTHWTETVSLLPETTLTLNPVLSHDGVADNDIIVEVGKKYNITLDGVTYSNLTAKYLNTNNGYINVIFLNYEQCFTVAILEEYIISVVSWDGVRDADTPISFSLAKGSTTIISDIQLDGSSYDELRANIAVQAPTNYTYYDRASDIDEQDRFAIMFNGQKMYSFMSSYPYCERLNFGLNSLLTTWEAELDWEQNGDIIVLSVTDPAELGVEASSEISLSIAYPGHNQIDKAYLPLNDYNIHNGFGESSLIINDSSNIAGGDYSAAFGYKTKAIGDSSFAEGQNTIAGSYIQHVQGIYNIKDTNDEYAHIVGNGRNEANRSNAHTLDWSGNGWFSGDVYVGSISGTNRDEGSKKLATEDFVTAALTALGLPVPTADDAGKILRVNAEGKYELTVIPNAEEATF